MTDVGMATPQQGMIGAFKGQPWVLYDTVASSDFRIGSPVNALGAPSPAINGQGEMNFFNTPSRNRANWPQLTNLDTPGTMSYGLKCYAIGVELRFPTLYSLQSTKGNPHGLTPAPTVGPSQGQRLAEALLNWSTLQVIYGQEPQFEYPLTSFSNAGALFSSTSVLNSQQNGLPAIDVALTLPEPIEMGRTQVITAKVVVAPFMFELIGQGADIGVGMPRYGYSLADDETTTLLPENPWALTVKLMGERTKLTQYGAAG